MLTFNEIMQHRW